MLAVHPCQMEELGMAFFSLLFLCNSHNFYNKHFFYNFMTWNMYQVSIFKKRKEIDGKYKDTLFLACVH